jgi:hypothetical protein
MKLKKIRNSDQSYGRGSDAVYTPARYGVFDGDVMVGIVAGRMRCYMEPANWEVFRMDGEIPRPAHSGFHTKKAATEWAMKFFGRNQPVARRTDR